MPGQIHMLRERNSASRVTAEDAELERVAKEHYPNKQERLPVKEFAKVIIGSGAHCSAEVR